MLFLGVDTGGTFTDFVLFDGERMRIHKVLSTPHAPEEAILEGVRHLGVESDGLRLIHGSTVATNAVLEGKGVRTVFVTNRGFRDLLTIGRQARAELYNLQPVEQQPPVPEGLCLETGGRLSSDGEVLEPLRDADLDDLLKAIQRLRPESVAVNLLFSWLDAGAEKRIGKALPDDLFVSLSSEVLPEIREYERGMATWLNAWIGPLVEGYVRRLHRGLPDTRLSVIQSSGDTVEATQAGGQAVRMLLSGPAGGLVGAGYLGKLAGRGKLLSFDMGGTSTDVALIDGEPQLTTEGRIGNWPVAVPMVDMHTIGAGGGSIARVDSGGMLQVGPESAGADPGPACYGRGGKEVAVTDANLVLGRLQPDAFLGGRMSLDREASLAAMRELAKTMGCSVEEAALGVIRVANEHMAQALRMISIQRGADPRDYTLVSFGGAGGMHVCALAEVLEVEEALVPTHAGVLSALGMLATRPGRQLSRTWQGLLAEREAVEIDAAFAELAARGQKALAGEGYGADALEFVPTLDLRYKGQSYTLNLLWEGLETTEEAFHTLHESRYGHRLEMPVEMVNLRQQVRGPGINLALDRLRPLESGSGGHHIEPDRFAAVYGIGAPVPVYERSRLLSGQEVSGPAVITEEVSTTWLAPQWECRVDAIGNLLLKRRRK